MSGAVGSESHRVQGLLEILAPAFAAVPRFASECSRVARWRLEVWPCPTSRCPRCENAAPGLACVFLTLAPCSTFHLSFRNL